MFTVFTASGAAVLFGSADFLGGVASKGRSALVVTVVAQFLSLPLLIAGLTLISAAPSRSDLLWGFGAGAANGIGIVCLYAALSIGRMGIVAPMSAAIAGAIPAAYGILREGMINVYGAAGIVLAIIAVLLMMTSKADANEDNADASPDQTTVNTSGWMSFTIRGGDQRLSVVLTLFAALGIAVATICFYHTQPESGLWPIAAGRSASIPMLTTLALVVHRPFSIDRKGILPSAAAGFLDTAALILILLALRSGPLAVASVLGSLYPLATILLARMFLQETWTPRQKAALALALIAIVLTAIP